jgi:hypothetical protein
MRANQLPHHCLTRLVSLDESAARLKQSADAAEREVERCRDILAGKRQNEIGGQDWKRVKAATDAVRQNFDSVYANAQTLRKSADTQMQVLHRCRAWIDRIPPNKRLTVIHPKVNGLDLDGARQKLNELRQELHKLTSQSVPSNDLPRRVRQYVGSLAHKCMVQGIGEGQTLRILWPVDERAATSRNGDGFMLNQVNPLYLAALLHPMDLTRCIMSSIEQSQPMPKEERAERIAEVTQQLRDLAYLHAHLVERTGGELHDALSPAPAILGVEEEERELV